MIEPLRYPAYRHLFSAQIIALLGTGLTTVALALLTYDLAGNKAGTVLGTALALKMIAYVSIAPVVGGLAGGVNRKRVLVILDLIRAGFVMCLPFVSEIWHIYLIIFLMQSCSAGFTPMFQSTIPDIIPDEKTYTKALSLSRLAYDLESLLSPALAAAALLFMSFDALFAMNSAAFLVSAILVVTAVLPAAKKKESEHVLSTWQKITFGTRAYLATPRLRGLLALSMAVAAAGAMVIVNTVVIIRSSFGMGERHVAYAFAAYGAGSMIAAFIIPKVLNKFADRPVMLTGAVLLATGLFTGTAANTFTWLMIVWFLLGIASSIINTPTGRLLRRSSSETDRPAYFSAHFSLSHACWLITYPLAGWLVISIGIINTYYLFGGIVVLGFLSALIFWPSKEAYSIKHIHKDLNPDHPHLEDAKAVDGGYEHTHDYVIDYHHKTWP